MSTPITVIITIAMMVILVAALIKGLDARFTLMALGAIFFFMVGLLNPSAIPEKTGYWFVDMFEAYSTQTIKTFTSPGIIIALLFGYVGYMDSIKANELFAIYATRPLKKIKHKYLLVAGAFILTFTLEQVMSLTAAACVALLAGTMYPIMRSLGVSKKTIICLMLVGTSYFVTPASVYIMMALDFMGSDMPPAVHYTDVQIPVMIPVILIVSIFVVLANRYFDKKDESTGVADNDDYGTEKDPDSLGIPKFYALLPLLPLTFIFAFNIFMPEIGASLQAIIVLCFFVAFTIVFLTSKNKLHSYGQTDGYFKGMANAFLASVLVTASCNYFGAALTASGGVDIMVNFLTSLSLGLIPMIIVFLIATYFVTYATSITLAVTIFTPVMGEYLVNAGRADLIIPVSMILVVAGGSCMMLAPTKPPLLLLSGMFNVPLKDITKRNIIPSIVSVVLITVISLIFV